MNNAQISQRTAKHVLNYFYGGEGYSGGSFMDALLRTIAVADQENLNKLALGYPEEVSAYWKITHDDQGAEFVRAIAAGF